MSTSHLLSIREIIENAFGSQETNTVNFKLIQAVLFILASQLRILERRFELDFGTTIQFKHNSLFDVSEIKISARKKLKESSHESQGGLHTKRSRASIKRDAHSKTSATSHMSQTSHASHKSITPSAKSLTPKAKAQIKTKTDWEELREKVLRIIEQRTDSREEAEMEPAPMEVSIVESSSETELQHEKLLVVELRSSDDTGAKRPTRLSLVTAEEFHELVDAVRALQARLLPPASADSQLLDQLHRGASLTEGMAGLQLSARVEGVEKTIEAMMHVVTQMSGMDPEAIKAKLENNKKSSSFKHHSSRQSAPTIGNIGDKPIAVDQLRDAFNHFDREWEGHLKKLNNQLNARIDSTSSRITNLEAKMQTIPDICGEFAQLKEHVTKFSVHVGQIDSLLATQMNDYQESLNQMQSELEVAIDNMNEMLANAEGDPLAVAELSNRFMAMQVDLDLTKTAQKDLAKAHDDTMIKFDGIWKQLESLRTAKADRDEVTDALKDKVGISALNGMVSLDQFEAVQADIDARIDAAYQKFNNQEIVWQKAIEDFFRLLQEKAQLTQVQKFREDVNDKLQLLIKKIKGLEDIVGEPTAVAVGKKILRDTACLSCCTPANLVEEGFATESPALLTLAQRKAGVPAPTDDGPCYPGKVITHPIDPRAEFCQRYCGGAHTVGRRQRGISSSLAVGRVATPRDPQPNDTVGDGVRPCIPCNRDRSPEVVEKERNLEVPEKDTLQPFPQDTFTGTVIISYASATPPMPSYDNFSN